ncbi:hypothetical protein AAF712_013959 [Marasmius tenuissimus]|uniref:Uncharacterized protein n=1 Tax=Marasmius tenuissimus TaxID=585030 RepID=A0ABR2ZEF1_9AGAR
MNAAPVSSASKTCPTAVSTKSVRVLQEVKLFRLITGYNYHAKCHRPSKAEPRSHDNTWILHPAKKLGRATTARDPTSIVLRRADDPPSDEGDAKATARVPGSEQERKLSVSLDRDRGNPVVGPAVRLGQGPGARKAAVKDLAEPFRNTRELDRDEEISQVVNDS